MFIPANKHSVFPIPANEQAQTGRGHEGGRGLFYGVHVTPFLSCLPRFAFAYFLSLAPLPFFFFFFFFFLFLSLFLTLLRILSVSERL